MISALIKAFTGRAGLLPSLLALLLIALTSAAVLLSLPRIEQKLENTAQTVLSDELTPGDSLVSLRAQGRNLVLEGQFTDAAGLEKKLKQISGVRSVVILGSDTGPETVEPQPPEPADLAAAATAQGDQQNAELEQPPEAVADTGNTEPESDVDAPGDTGVVTETPEVAVAPEGMVVTDEDKSMIQDELLAQAVPEPVVGADSNAESGSLQQSSLSLRYDGTRLRLSGHLADEQMAQLIAERVASVIPPYSVLEIALDGTGKGSPLNWMREFLAAVAGLPDDAQGQIEGSDRGGVKIVPDAEQTLATQSETPTASEDAGNSGTDPAPESDAEPALETAPEQTELTGDVGADMLPDPAAQADTGNSLPDEAPVVVTAPEAFQPNVYITDLNSRLAEQDLFESGDYVVVDRLAAELDELAEMLLQNPRLVLRVVGNIDFSVDRRYAEYVGIDRAREVKKYLYSRHIAPARVFVTPLPGDRAYDKRVQLVFYISE